MHQNENAGVLQNVSTHSPKSGHNDPKNDPLSKWKTLLTKLGTKMRTKMTLKIRTKMDMRRQIRTKMKRRT